MKSREAIIDGLKRCRTESPYDCKGCPYEKELGCSSHLMNDALGLIAGTGQPDQIPSAWK
jgi:hypothetical protein